MSADVPANVYALEEKVLSNQQDEKNIQYMPVQMMPMAPDDDEIDLLELWHALMLKKWLVLGITLACLLAGTGYAFLAMPVYKTEAYFLPPSVADVVELNIISGNSIQYTPAIVYQMFLQNLSSRELRRKFFTKNGIFPVLADGDKDAVVNQVFEKKFNEKLVLQKVDNKRDKNTSFHSLSFEWKDASSAADWTNMFVSMVMDYTRNTLINDMLTLKKNQIKYFEQCIVSKRKTGRNLNKDQILRFKEALGIAKELGITADRLSGSNIQSVDKKINNNVLDKMAERDMRSVTIYNNVGRLYLQGSKALGAQLKALQNRKSDDPFIPGLCELQEKLDTIKMATISQDHIQVAKIDQSAQVPDKPIKPKKRLIIALAGVVGLFMGIFAAFFMCFVQKMQKKEL